MFSFGSVCREDEDEVDLVVSVGLRFSIEAGVEETSELMTRSESPSRAVLKPRCERNKSVASFFLG